jgi:hypothetical protein
MPSKHSSAAQLIGNGLYDNLQSFPELENRISASNALSTGDGTKKQHREILTSP